jgi:hypothetical protein
VIIAGWISIDCGAASSYTDPVTGIRWVTDAGYISTGVNVEVPNAPQDYPDFEELLTVRVFNNSRAKNCYALGPLVPNNTYMIRASFLYTLYDGAAISSPLPTFQAAIGTTVVGNVTFSDQSALRVLEHTLMAKNDTIHYCLVHDQSLSNPFVSAIVVRKIDQAIADVWFNSSNPSELSRGFIFRTRGRVDFGGSPYEVIRFFLLHVPSLNPYSALRVGFQGVFTAFGFHLFMISDDLSTLDGHGRRLTASCVDNWTP